MGRGIRKVIINDLFDKKEVKEFSNNLSAKRSTKLYFSRNRELLEERSNCWSGFS